MLLRNYEFLSTHFCPFGDRRTAKMIENTTVTTPIKNNASIISISSIMLYFVIYYCYLVCANEPYRRNKVLRKKAIRLPRH